MTMRVFALMIAAATLVGGQSPQSRTLIVSVVDAEGGPVTGLVGRDFTVEIGGVPVPAGEARQAGGPLSTLLLFDRSQSVQRVPFGSTNVSAAGRADQFLEANTASAVFSGDRHASDRVYFGRFSGFTEFRGPVAPDASAWQAVLNWGLAFDGGSSSPVWDAVADAAKHIERDPGTKLIILVTDGRGNANLLSLEDAARHVVRAGVAVSVIDIGYREQVRQNDKLVAVPRPDRLLMWLTEATGGHYVSDATVLRTRKISVSLLGSLVDRHRQAYRLQIDVPPGLPSPQSVKVTVNRAGATARTAAFLEVR